jgi:hypothetical protein
MASSSNISFSLLPFRVIQIPAFSIQILQIMAFLIPGFTDFGFFLSEFYMIFRRLFPFRVLQIPAFLIPGFTDSGFNYKRLQLIIIIEFLHLRLALPHI